MKKYSYKNPIAWLIVSLFISIVLLIVIITMPSLPSDTEENTTEYKATFISLEKKEKDYLVKIEEYNFKLFVNKETIIDDKNIKKLEQGETLYFRPISNDLNSLNENKVKQTAVVTLRTESFDIVTLESSNEYSSYQERTMKRVLICGGTLFLIIFVVSVIRIIRIYFLKKNGGKRKSI